MRRLAFAVCSVVLVWGCGQKSALEQRPPETESLEHHITNERQLTFEGDNGEAYFSWDDSRLIYQSDGGLYPCDKIWIMNVDGSDKHIVSPKRGAHTCAFFLPGDEKVVFASTSHLSGECPPETKLPAGRSYRYIWSLYPYNIFIANMNGSGLKRLTDNPEYDAEPVASSDGTRVVFGSQRDGDFDVYVMDVDGANVTRLTDKVGYDGGPWFSPDGKKIVWRAWYPETRDEQALWRECMENDYIVGVPLDIWIMDADGSNKVRLVHNGATNWAPSWHPDGKRIIFSSNMDDWREDLKTFGHNFELYLVNLDGTGLEQLTYNTVFDSFPMFSHDGKKLAFASNRNPQKPRATDIFIADWVE